MWPIKTINLSKLVWEGRGVSIRLGRSRSRSKNGKKIKLSQTNRATKIIKTCVGRDGWGVSIRLARSIDTIIKDYCHLLGLSQMCCSYILYCLLLHCTLSCVALHTVLSDTPFSYYVVYCSVQNPCKEWCVLASGDNDRGNGDTKTNMNNHQHHPAEGIENRFDLVSAKQMLLNQSFPSETSNHNSEPLNCDLTEGPQQLCVTEKWERFGEAGIWQFRNHPWRAQFSG